METFREIFWLIVFSGCLVTSIWKGMQFLAFMCLLVIIFTLIVKYNETKEEEKDDASSPKI